MSDRRRRPEVSRLWHFTCRHSAEKIDAQGVLIPNLHPWWSVPLVWLTDLEDAPAEVLFGTPTGLLECDRSEVRYEVQDVTGCVPWTSYARSVQMHRTVRDMFETAGGGTAMPAHWWVSTRPLPIVAAAVPVL